MGLDNRGVMQQQMRIEPVVVDENASADATAGCFQAIGIMMISVVFAVLAAIFGLWMIVSYSPLAEFSDMPPGDVAGRFVLAVIDDVGEEPSVSPAPAASFYPIDPSVDPVYAGVLERAFDLMRATEEGARLFDVLVENDVPVFVEEIDYNAGYTETRWTRFGWVSSDIVIDADSVRSRNLDALAAILVHEATHAARAISGESCFYDDACETLENGVSLDEEVAAHAVEAQFWLDLYGDDGKRLAFSSDSGENRLLDAWLDGDRAFETYVREIRGDEREGAGI